MRYTFSQSNDGYTLTKINDSETLSGDTTATFTDTLESTTPTGIFLKFIPYILLLFGSTFGIVWIKKFNKI